MVNGLDGQRVCESVREQQGRQEQRAKGDEDTVRRLCGVAEEVDGGGRTRPADELLEGAVEDSDAGAADDRPRPAVASHRGASEQFRLGGELTEGLKQMRRREGVTLYMSMLGGLAVVLSRYSGQQDIAVGTAIAGRNRAEMEGLIGFFVNTLVMRTEVKGGAECKGADERSEGRRRWEHMRIRMCRSSEWWRRCSRKGA